MKVIVGAYYAGRATPVFSDSMQYDTPEDELFAKDVRAFSHGCIRLEHPAELAQFALGWSADSVHRQMTQGKNDHRVNLARKIPVYIVYFTAYVRDGELYFGNDLYSRDDALVRAVDNGSLPNEERARDVQTLRKLVGS